MDIELTDWQERIINGKELGLIVVSGRCTGRTTAALMAAKNKPNTALVVSLNPEPFDAEGIKACLPQNFHLNIRGRQCKSKDGTWEQIILDDPICAGNIIKAQELYRDVLAIRRGVTRVVVLGASEIANSYRNALYYPLSMVSGWELINV